VTARIRKYFALGLGAYFLLLCSSVIRLMARLSWSRKGQILLAGMWAFGFALTAVGLWSLLSQRGRRAAGVLDNAAHWSGGTRAEIKVSILVVLIAIPMILVFSALTARYANVGLTRLVIFAPFLTVMPLFWPWKEPEGFFARGLLCVVAVATIIVSASWLMRVRTFPFSLDWDEGNRLYDYSLIFGRRLYRVEGSIEFPYGSPGRYGLWGLPFLISGVPIWLHRLWDAIIRVIPAYVVGWLLVRQEERRLLRFGLAGALAIFLLQGRIYSTLLLSAALVFAVWKGRYTLRAATVIPAGWYASLSRWTWSFAPASWAAIIDLFLFYPHRRGHWFKRLVPTAVIWLLGAIPGMIVHWGRFFSSGSGESELAFSQPLLWYRLLPNETYPEGILLALLMVMGPLVVVLIWLVYRGRWKLDIWQRLGATAFMLVFLTGGLVASVKIGGGSDLHNLDVFIITALLLAALAYGDARQEGPLFWDGWPGLVRLCLASSLLIASWNVLRWADVTNLPDAKVVEKAFRTLQEEVENVEASGEVLFMDQRQFLTFHYVEGVELVPEYEKKYLMDMAMAANEPYFEQLYRDLANKRFALIVSHPLKVQYEGRTHPFGLEDDAWVRWVSEPVLCYYQPLKTLDAVRVMLLVPREGRADCPFPAANPSEDAGAG
jgi:hypothetical protein